MSKRKEIHCPICNEKVANYDGKGKIDIITRCRKCNKRIIYRIETENIEVKELPPRSCSSGLMFN